MRRFLRFFVLVIIPFSIHLSCGQDSVPITNMAFFSHNGVIRGASSHEPICSAFVVGPNKDVVTSWHAVEAARVHLNETNFLFVGGTNVCTLAPKAYLKNFDLAVYYARPKISGAPFCLGDFGTVKVGDTVVYVGYDERQITTNRLTRGTSSCALAVVEAKTNRMINGRKVDMLVFVGEAIPGYSGGAVYNTNLEIIAIIHGIGSQKLNFAYSIAPLLEFQILNTNAQSSRRD